MLPDDLADGPQLLRLEEVGPDPPHDLAVAPDDGDEAGLPAADDHVGRREPPIAFVEPAVRSDVRRRVDVQPVEASAFGIDAAAPGSLTAAGAPAARRRGDRGLLDRG